MSIKNYSLLSNSHSAIIEVVWVAYGKLAEKKLSAQPSFLFYFIFLNIYNYPGTHHGGCRNFTKTPFQLRGDQRRTAYYSY